MGKRAENISIVDQGLIVDGNITCTGKLIVKGVVKGTLDGETVIIAEASAKSVTIGGSFEGVINAEKELIVLSTGVCSGRVVCHDLVVEAGGVLNAEVICMRQLPADGDADGTVKKVDFSS
ncbi:hypothetical protein D3OALGA1CA_3396 [Olavius algarvensis associated proteobacterium Delta 3]|nr:hypothetical protein D3OALGB2SA_3329 [Olavius algarvensis associated proteobacterium Delta 3]CAB5133721.1 hypothetical protein D3OALGA1CA_3396 [Olavius algarvensis associated proteobacterium Delta 3]